MKSERITTNRFLAEYKGNVVSGIYMLWDKGDIVYIGRSGHIRSRVKRHVRDKDFDSVSFTQVAGETSGIEVDLIAKHLPKYNSTREFNVARKLT